METKTVSVQTLNRLKYLSEMMKEVNIYFEDEENLSAQQYLTIARDVAKKYNDDELIKIFEQHTIKN